MRKISVRSDGWVALPTRLRQLLGLKAGDELEAEVEDGELILRPVGTVAAAAEAPAVSEPVPAPAPPGGSPSRKRGRPKKVAAPPPVRAAGRKSGDALRKRKA